MPQVQTSGYPIAEDVLNDARAMINDMLRTTGGTILTDTQTFTNTYLNMAIRRVQRELANNGITSNIRDDVILTPLTPAVGSDPSIQVYVSSLGYFDGANVNPSPTLPADLIFPLELWERQTGASSQFIPMMQPQEGLNSRMPGSYFGQWEWREDRINMTGSTMTEDLRVRYEAAIPRIAVPQSPATYATVSIPIRDGEDALSAAVALQYARTRGSALRQEAKQWFDDEMYQLINRYVRRDQRIAYRPRGYRAGAGRIDGALQGDLK
jgi:hypothetical protein